MSKKFICLCLLLSLTISGCGKLTNNKKDSENLIKEETSANFTKSEEKNSVTEGSVLETVAPKETAKTEPSKEIPKVEPQKELKPTTNNSNVNNTTLSTVEKDWFYQPRTDGTPSGEPADIVTLISKYGGYYVGDTSKKVIYLTFDEGYENGYSGKILDILKENNVKAAFFVTTDYINRNKELIKRMVTEGHLVCNHSTTHPSMASIKDRDKFGKELQGCESAFEAVTGTKMPAFFRPPMGKYSELSLQYTQSFGYKTIFWSFAYGDWEPAKQPTHEAAKKVILERTHGGGIFLLHAVSKTNTEILDFIIKEWKNKGFELKTLNELPA